MTIYIGVIRGSQNLVAQATEFRMVASNIFSIITSVVHLYTKMCVSSLVPAQRASDNSKVHRSLQNLWSSVLNLIHVALTTPRI